MTLRGLDWAVVLGGSGLGGAILLPCILLAPDAAPVAYVRLALVALVAAGAFVLDEPAAAAIDATPATLAQRTTARVSGLLPPLAVWTVGVLALEQRHDQTPAAALLVEGAGAMAVALALAAVLRRAGHAEPGEAVATVCGSAILGLILFDTALRSVPFFPIDQAWAASTALWTCLTLASAILTVGVSGDPYRR